MQHFFRSSHIPINEVDIGYKTYLMPNRGAASFNIEGNGWAENITSFANHVIREQEQFSAPSISYLYYGTIQYWWCICMFNGIVFPTSELYTGREIRIPEQSQLETYLSANKIGGSSSNINLNQIQRI